MSREQTDSPAERVSNRAFTCYECVVRTVGAVLVCEAKASFSCSQKWICLPLSSSSAMHLFLVRWTVAIALAGIVLHS
jgi:hypothetical protein